MLPYAPFGATGHQSSRIIFGAAALGGMSQNRALSTLDLVFSHGVNHIDTASMYGVSEDHLKPWLANHRSHVFLATKTSQRSGPKARAELEKSLTRMGVDQIDLIQLHSLVEPDEWATAFGSNGAVAALAQARDEGLVRFIGVTGHGLRIPAMHIRSLQNFNFDSVLFPFSTSLLKIDHYRRDVADLQNLCGQRNIAMQTIKAVARRRWDDATMGHRSWYEPLTDPQAIERAVHFVLSHENLFLNTTSDANLLPIILQAASVEITRPTPEQIDDDIERFGIRSLFDGDQLERI